MPPFDVDAELIRRLAALLDETGLGEIEYDDGRRRIRVAKPAVANAAPPVAITVPAPPAGEPAAAAIVAPDASHPGAVTAPMVGTAYLASEPGAPPFVQAGDAIAKGQVLLIIEAMKVMNQIQAPRAGTLRRVLVENGAPVEYGEVLMIVE